MLDEENSCWIKIWLRPNFVFNIFRLIQQSFLVKVGANQSKIPSNIFSACLIKCWMKNYVFIWRIFWFAHVHLTFHPIFERPFIHKFKFKIRVESKVDISITLSRSLKLKRDVSDGCWRFQMHTRQELAFIFTSSNESLWWSFADNAWWKTCSYLTLYCTRGIILISEPSI